MKSFINLDRAPSLAYTSEIARSSELEPKIRSTRVAFHFNLPVFLSHPSNISSSPEVGFQTVSISKRFTKKSFVRAPTLFVKIPY